MPGNPISEVDAELVAMRAAELSIEQKARHAAWMKNRDRREEFSFWVQAAEVEATIHISNLLHHYSLLKGLITADQPLRVTRSIRKGAPIHDH